MSQINRLPRLYGPRHIIYSRKARVLIVLALLVLRAITSIIVPTNATSSLPQMPAENQAVYDGTIKNVVSDSFASGGGQSSPKPKVAEEDVYEYLPLVLKNHFFTWDSFYEPNDDYWNAFGPITSGYTYQAYPDDMDDYYFFTLAAQSMVSVRVDNFAPTSSYGTVVLYGPVFDNEQGDLVDYYGPPGATTMVLRPHSLGPGKYYVRVFTRQNVSNSVLYSLTVTY